MGKFFLNGRKGQCDQSAPPQQRRFCRRRLIIRSDRIVIGPDHIVIRLTGIPLIRTAGCCRCRHGISRRILVCRRRILTDNDTKALRFDQDVQAAFRGQLDQRADGRGNAEDLQAGTRVLAGLQTTATTVTEYGQTFSVDLERAYFSARLASERQRVLAMMQDGEEVLDMFAGVGPFAIILARRAAVVWACDLNPGAVSLLTDNIRINRISNIVPILGDAGVLPRILGRRATRVIMNLPLHAEPYLPAAFSLCLPGGMIHYYALVSEEEGDPDFSRLPEICQDLCTRPVTHGV